MTDDRIPVYLTHDEAEMLLEMPGEYQGQRCCYCRAWWSDGVGYDHDERCVLQDIRAAAQAALPDTPRRRAYAEYLEAADEKSRAYTALREASGSGSGDPEQDAGWKRLCELRLDRARRLEKRAWAHYEETRDAEAAKKRGDTKE